MKKTLLYLDENLQSSIALRYADYLSSMMELSLNVMHVEEPDSKEQVGTGWVRRSWEAGMKSAGLKVVNRLMKTEKIKFNIERLPIIAVGKREDEVVSELRRGNYDIYMEGHMDTGAHDRFWDLLSSKIYQETSCPKLIVKNLTVSDKVAILLGDGIDHKNLFDKYHTLLQGTDFVSEPIYFKYREQDSLTFADISEAGSAITETSKLLDEAGISHGDSKVLCGIPEHAGDFLRNYAFIISTLPVRKSLIMEVLSNCPASLLLC